MIPIVDAHHHIWRQADLPWLQGPMLPRIFGPYEPIRRDYPIEEFLDDIASSGVEKSVYVQCNWAKDKAVEEVAWVQGVADAHGWPHAIVGYADLLSDDVAATLKKQAKFPLMRGIRMQLHWHDNEMYRFAASPDLMNDPRLRRNIRLLAEYGWSFDLQVFASQMADAAKLAADNPDITFILQHAGMLEDLSPQGRAQWREGMKRLAGQPNVVSKLSGLGTFIHRTIRPISLISLGKRSRCSAIGAAFSAAISRSRSCGPAMPIWSRHTGRRSPRSPRQHRGPPSPKPPLPSTACSLRLTEDRPRQ